MRRDPVAEAEAILIQQGRVETPPKPKLQLERDAISAVELSHQQTQRAIDKLRAAPSKPLVMPYESLHAIVGRLAPGSLTFVVAHTGQGKTTFMLDVFDRWAQSGVRIDFLGTEQEPDELRTKWACLRCGVPAGVAINAEWDEWQLGEYWREKVEEDLCSLDDAYGEQVVFVPEKFVTMAKVEAAARSAQSRGAQVLVVDHIDRIETEATDSEYLALKRLVRRLKELARDHSLSLVVASQLNREGRKGDRLGAYRAPQLHHMQGGATKEQEADVVLGLWRPLRTMHPGESLEEFKAAMDAAMKGNAEPETVLEPDTMAVVLLKHRTWGNREGKRCRLRVTHGRIGEIPERDKYTTRPGMPGQV